MNKEKDIKKRLKVAEIIQTARIQKDWTQEELANKIGYARSTIQRIEAGKFSPNADQLYEILDVLGLELKINNEKI
ncbi:helix-turn-helix domain-containing protein [Riemerella anatipestifer]|uniref:helix-turn-helix domain-containing protein n=1 Tax=Riemerella anatipestifer TaxID=34085 RepID=UPI00208E8776|nr:helix-turn-helix transcriptional regulator [Riemerella anatipestifer]MCO4303224.1 helix-turn-helix domain-containing protein [Riemerella anatipestifer]MCO7353636.1 helix-turn-helix domain-containing protein [Riemerella anatipestifer]MCQ4039002.1 helix-turn-helix domain-containing protein [Riemerella anatipestifer]MCT6759940.1 helix-turn-helix domain-containing protein [Riemerella anatipestifer]MCT6767853.1 helix-turn-helix domain-containing protein [Riemerella anatipestifer]